MGEELAVIEIHAGEVVNIPLTPEEREEHERRLTRIHDLFEEIGYKSLSIWKDLQWINANQTYREKYDSWNDFCLAELGKDNSTIYRHFKDAALKEELLLSASSDEERLSIMALKESNTRFIRTLPEDVQGAFWKLTFALSAKTQQRASGPVETTTTYMESLASRMNEILELGGLHIDGEFVSVDSVVASAELENVDEATAKTILLRAGVTEEAYEALQRQAEHIKERSVRADVTTLKGTIGIEVDVNGSSYPVLLDSRGNMYDVAEIISSFNSRFVSLTIKAPIRDTVYDDE